METKVIQKEETDVLDLARLLEAHRRDFREGRVAKLAGWTLSLTELRLCALVRSRSDG